jgi:hypothetical protein
MTYEPPVGMHGMSQQPPPQPRPPAGPPPPSGHPSGPPTVQLAGPVAGPAHQQPRPHVAVNLFAAASLAAVAIGISVPEDGQNAWHTVKAWGGVALVAAALTFAPAVGSAMRLSAYRAWQVAAGGAAGLALYWVLFVLPDIAKNTSLITTLGVAAGIVVAWIAPGRHAPGAPHPPGPTW